MKNLFLSTLVLFLFSCSSTVVNEKPNFNLAGEEAQKEYKKFEIDRVSGRYGRFKSESVFTSFKVEKYKDTLKDISPKASEMVPKQIRNENTMWLIWLGWLVSSIYVRGNENQLFYYGGMASFIGYLGFVIEPYSKEITDQYNKDLKNKFNPKLSYSFKF